MPVLLGLLLAACGGGGGGGGADLVAPGLVARTPADQAELVPLASTVAVTFDEELDLASLSTDSFVLEVDGVRLGTNLHYDARTATLTPVRPLPGGAVVTARLTADVRDASGNPLAGPIEWSFSTPHASFGFAANADDGTFSSLRVEADGTLAHASFAVPGGAPAALAVHPNGRFVYALLGTGEALAAYELESTSGALTLIDPPVATGRGPSALALAPNGRRAWVTNLDDDTLSLFELDALDGMPTPTGVLGTGGGPIDLVVDPLGRQLVVACRRARELRSYALDPASGALQLTHTFALPVAPRALALDARGEFLYVASASGQSLGVLALAEDGTLSEVQTLATGADRPLALALDPAGRFLHVAFEQGSLGTFRVDLVAGTLVEVGARLAVGLEPRAVAVDPAGKAVHVACFAANELVSFALDPATGLPGAEARLLARPGPLALAFAPGVALPPERRARFAYVPLAGSDQLATLTLDPRSGEAFVGDVFATGDEPSAVVVDPQERFAIVAHARDGELALHGFDPLTELLDPAPLGTEAVGGYPSELALTPEARFVVVANLANDELQVVDVEARTGTLRLVQSEPLGAANPSQLALAPNGSLVFTLTTDPVFPSQLFVHGLEPARGALTPITSVVVGPAGIDLAVDPRGQYLFVAHGDGPGGVKPYRIVPESGALVALTPFVTGDLPGGLACEPRGRALYVTGNFMGIVSGFALERATDSFPSLGAFAPAGARPASLAFEPNGRFGLVASSLTHELARVTLDAEGVPSSDGETLSLPMTPLLPAFRVGP